MANWWHNVRGRYDIADKWIGLDYSKLIDPIEAEIVLGHESVHSVIALTTDFGQASNVIFKLLNDFKHISPDERKSMAKLLISTQDCVQEGFATFLQISQLRKLTSKKNALIWSENKLPEYYKEKISKLMFAFDWSSRYRDYFTGKIAHLAMETGIRRDLHKMSLLKKFEAFSKYLSIPDKNPNARLDRFLDAVRAKPWLVTKSYLEIAKVSGVEYFGPTSKQDIASFLNYSTSFTNNPLSFTAKDIGESPKGALAFEEASKNMIIGNMNFNLTETAETIFNYKDFLHYSDSFEVVFLNLHSKDWKHRSLFKALSGEEPDISLLGITGKGEKYLTAVSKKTAEGLLNGELKNVTLIVKWGGFDIVEDNFIWSKVARVPDLIIYNTSMDLKTTFEKLIEKSPESKLVRLHAGFTKGHPIQTLIIRVEERKSYHVVNVFGDRGVSAIIKSIKEVSTVMEKTEIIKQKKHLNNLMSVWMGLHWEIDWIKTMLDKKTLSFR